MNKNIKVMILNNDMEFLLLLKNYINAQKNMNIVFWACDGTNAIQYIRHTKPDILLLDIVMYEKNGLTVLEEISKEPKYDMPLVFIMSSISDDRIIQKAISLGAMYYFIKPFNIKKIVERVKYLMIP